MKKIILIILIVMNFSCQTTKKHTIMVVDTSVNTNLTESKDDINKK